MHPFPSVVLRSGRSEIEVAEVYCKRITSSSTSAVVSIFATSGLSTSNAVVLDCPFTMRELLNALASVNRPSAPGSDKITYSTLVHLGVIAVFLDTKAPLNSVSMMLIAEKLRL